MSKNTTFKFIKTISKLFILIFLVSIFVILLVWQTPYTVSCNNNLNLIIQRQYIGGGIFAYSEKDEVRTTLNNDLSVNGINIFENKYNYTSNSEYLKSNKIIYSCIKNNFSLRLNDGLGICYLNNKYNETDYPECIPEIKAKFELK